MEKHIIVIIASLTVAVLASLAVYYVGKKKAELERKLDEAEEAAISALKRLMEKMEKSRECKIRLGMREFCGTFYDVNNEGD